jgi:transcriptional regulator with XRE-family HTH domain
MLTLKVALGRAIRRLRTERGFSQEGLALAAGINRTYATDLENGKRNVSLEILERVAEALSLNTGELLTEAEFERRRPKTEKK